MSALLVYELPQFVPQHAPGLIRTGDLAFRKRLLYPPELRARGHRPRKVTLSHHCAQALVRSALVAFRFAQRERELGQSKTKGSGPGVRLSGRVFLPVPGQELCGRICPDCLIDAPRYEDVDELIELIRLD